MEIHSFFFCLSWCGNICKKNPMPTCRLCLYSTLFHTTCISLSSSIRRTLFYPIPIPNKYIVVQWFSRTFQQWLYYVYKFFSYDDDDAKTAYFKATKCILFTYIYYTSLKGEYLKNGYFSLKLFIRIWTLPHSAILLVSVT